MQPEHYQRLLNKIRYCKQLDVLSEIVQGILEPTGFGSNSIADTGEIQLGLDYYEMAVCLKETDQRFFQKEIELLIFAHQQVSKIEAGQVPDEPVPVPAWQMFT